MSAALGEASVRSRSGAILALLSFVLLGAGCGGFFGSGGGEADAEVRFRTAAAAVESGRFEPGARALREVASRCESGGWGAEAVLLLAAVEIDPRNPRPSPGAGARLAARYLQIPGTVPSSRAAAETLYLLALDLGAAAIDDPFAPVPVESGRAGESADAAADGSGGGVWRVAERFGGCGEGGRRSLDAPLPEHPGMPLWRAVESAYRERDSLAARSLAGADEAERLRLRVDSLEAELERIRSLLQRVPEGPPPGGGAG